MKLSKNQQKVIDLMKEGWELGSGYSGAWVQKGGLGKCGETVRISMATLSALLRKDLVKFIGRVFPTNHYLLTEKGRQ